jgi:hypothetical protein
MWCAPIPHDTYSSSARSGLSRAETGNRCQIGPPGGTVDRPCRASACCTSGSVYRAVMSSISVGPWEGRAAYAEGQALVMGGAEHHQAGHAEELADLA